MTCKAPDGDISAVTLIRTDTTLDHSQKAETVCLAAGGDQGHKQKTTTASTFGLGGVTRKLACWFRDHSGAVLLQIKPTTTEIGAERSAKNQRFILMCPIHGNLYENAKDWCVMK